MPRVIVSILALAMAVACHDGGALAPPPDSSTTISGYEAIDLGTLGGWSTTPVAFNDRGQVVGYSDRVRVASEGLERESRAFLWDDGTMYDLALIPGGTSMGEAINGLGQIAGRRNPDYPAETRAFVWDSLTPARDLEARAGAVPQQVVGISDQGDVLALEFADLLGFRAVLWRAGTRQDLPGLHPDGENIPRALSRGGRAVGSSYVYERGSPYDFFHPVVWDNGQVTDLGVLSHGSCPLPGPVECGHGAAIDMNESGVVVGWSNTTSLTRAFRWQNGVLTELGGLPGQPMWAWAVNDRGQIAGDWGSSPVGGFLWASGVTIELGSLGGGGTHVRALSEDGQVVGSSLTTAGGQHAFVWREGQMTDLGLGPSPIGAQASVAIAINARGDILGVSGNCSRNWDGSCNLVWPMRGILWRRIDLAGG